MFLGILWTWTAICAAGEPAQTLLASNGKTDWCIAVGEDATTPEQTAAKELAHYLSKATGAEFAVKPLADVRPEAPCILVGQTDAVRRLLPDMDWGSLGCDGIVIQTSGTRWILAGGRPRGTLYAVYTFLQDALGCRWYAHDAEEVVPHRPTLNVEPIDRTYRPPFDLRQLYTHAIESKTDPLFAVKLRLNSDGIPELLGGGVGAGGAHTLPTYLPAKEYFDGHSDWFAWDGTKRVPDNLCYTSEEMRKVLAEKVLEQLDREYAKWKFGPKLLSVSGPDGGMHCRCEKCVAALHRDGSDSGALVDLVNYVAERVEPRYPDVWISTLAYWNTAAPPRQTKPRHNVLVQFAISNEGFDPPDQRERVVQRDFRLPFSKVPAFSQYLIDWSKIASHLYVWDYDTNFTNMVQPHPTYFAFPESLAFYRECKVTGVYCQGSWTDSGDFPQMKAWVNAQMLWNPDQDVRALMRDFLNGYYGNAATALMEYLELMNELKGRLGPYDSCTRSWLRLADLNKATSLLQQAEAAVAENETQRLRMQRVRLGIDIVWLQRYRELRREAERSKLPFLGSEDPYAEAERIARDELHTHTYAEWVTFDAYIGLLRKLFPARTGKPPVECQGLKPYQWEEICVDRLTAVPPACAKLADDSSASSGRALILEPIAGDARMAYEMPATASGGLTTAPTYLAGRYRAYAVLRAKPSTSAAAAVALGITTDKEVCRKVVEFSAQEAQQYRTVDLGSHEIPAGARIWIEADNQPEKRPKSIHFDRFFLVFEGDGE